MFSENMVCIAMPLFDPNGDIYAAISVSSSKTMDPAMLSYYRGALEETIKKVNNFWTVQYDLSGYLHP